jgi:predicted metalloendopeptidase
LLLTGTHSMPDVCVNQALKNLAEFAEVFKCQVGQPMNPEQRCRVW